MKKIVAILFVGALLQALLHYCFVHSVIGFPDEQWAPFIASLILVFAKVAPGFLVGWVAKRSGFLLGAIACVLGQLFYEAMAVGHDPWSQTLLMSVAPAIFSSVAGAAGELARMRRPPSNNSFKPKPLRGSA